MTLLGRVAASLVGESIELPPALVARFPELATARWRRGGLALRVGGWCLGRATVSGITLGRTIAIAHGVALNAELLLHELRHVQQFEEDWRFPVRYVLGTLRHGYTRNPYEADARAFATRRLSGAPHTA